MSAPQAEAIVVGTSAGGLKALIEILPGLEGDYPLPILVVIHIPPYQQSLIPELIQARCKLRVKEAEDKEPILGGVIYFAPPDYHLLVEPDRRLSLSSEEQVEYSRPAIDVLFESAADVFGSGLVGIVLTGGNRDGAAGLRQIVDCGGRAVVQCPQQAETPEMPRHALAACPEAKVMRLAEIAGYLKEVASSA